MQSTNENQHGSDVNHPSQEYWMSYLYREISRPERKKLAAHLAECAQCRAKVANWENAMSALDDGKLLGKRTPFRAPQTFLKWGIAAALTITIGFGAGRVVSPAAADTQALRASLKSEIRAELIAEIKQQQDQLLIAYKQAAEQQRASDDKLILNAIDKMDVNRRADYASLRKELETVAVLTQDSLQRAQQQIVTLASYSQPDGKFPKQ